MQSSDVDSPSFVGFPYYCFLVFEYRGDCQCFYYLYCIFIFFSTNILCGCSRNRLRTEPDPTDLFFKRKKNISSPFMLAIFFFLFVPFRITHHLNPDAPNPNASGLVIYSGKVLGYRLIRQELTENKIKITYEKCFFPSPLFFLISTPRYFGTLQSFIFVFYFYMKCAFGLHYR